MTSDVSQTTSFGSQCVQNTFCTDIEPFNAYKLPEMSDWDQSDDLELLQGKLCVGIQDAEISIKTVSEPTEVNFQPIPAYGGSISVAETVFDSYQGSRTLRNR